MEIGANIGAPVGAVAGGVGIYAAGRFVTKNALFNDFTSAGGALIGEKFSQLPVVPRIVTATVTRSYARKFIEAQPSLQQLPAHAKNFLLDGVAVRAGSGLNDPNKVLDAMQQATEGLTSGGTKIVEKFFKGGADEAGEAAELINQAVKTVRTQGVKSINATAGGWGARKITAGAVVGAALIGAAIGSYGGKAFTTPSIQVDIPTVSKQDLPNISFKLQRPR